MNSPLILGITGGMACGKTETGRILSAEGFKVLDCDFLAHELMECGRPVYDAVVEYFGDVILAKDGEINRQKLSSVVFANPSDLATLNRLVHPAVIAAAKEWIQECRTSREDAAVLVPLLFEAGWTDGWDAVVCITAPEENVFQWLEKRGIETDEAHKRIAAQMPLAEKAAQSDFVIENGGTLEALRNQIIGLIEKIRCEKRKSHE